jgi:L-asparagine transporter-like permease
MKKMMTIGGLAGFASGLALGLAQDISWPSILFRSSVAAVAAGLLLRWWGKIWLTSLEQSYFEQLAAAAAAAAQAASPSPQTKRT